MDRGPATNERLSHETLSDLIGRIYDCAVEPGRWPTAMEAIRRALNFEVSTLNLQRLPSFEVVLNVTSNVPAAFIPLIAGAGTDVVEQWGGAERIAGLAFDEPGVLSWVNPAFDPQTTTNRYYLEFARPQGLVDVMAVMLARDAHGLGSIAWGRHEREGPIGEWEVGVARLLAPHLQRAATINRLLDIAALAKASFEAVLDKLSAPILIVEAGPRLLHANPAALRLLNARDVLHVRNGVLAAHDAEASAALASAVSQAAFGPAGGEIPVSGCSGAVAVLHVVPLPISHGAWAGGGRAAVFVARPSRTAAPPGASMRALFGLTAREARVFACVAAGLTVAEAAQELGIGLATVKTHLLRIYQKTGVHRREELMQMAAALTLPLEP